MGFMQAMASVARQAGSEYRKTAVLPDPNHDACTAARRELVTALRAYQEVVTLDEFQPLGRSFMELYGFLLMAMMADAEGTGVAK